MFWCFFPPLRLQTHIIFPPAELSNGCSASHILSSKVLQQTYVAAQLLLLFFFQARDSQSYLENRELIPSGFTPPLPWRPPSSQCKAMTPKPQLAVSPWQNIINLWCRDWAKLSWIHLKPSADSPFPSASGRDTGTHQRQIGMMCCAFPAAAGNRSKITKMIQKGGSNSDGNTPFLVTLLKIILYVFWALRPPFSYNKSSKPWRLSGSEGCQSQRWHSRVLWRRREGTEGGRTGLQDCLHFSLTVWGQAWSLVGSALLHSNTPKSKETISSPQEPNRREALQPHH